MNKPDVRKGIPPRRLDRETFERRNRAGFADPIFDSLSEEIGALTAAAWDGYSKSRKSPRTRKGGPGFADSDYEIAVDWLNTRDALPRSTAISAITSPMRRAIRRSIAMLPFSRKCATPPWLWQRPLRRSVPESSSCRAKD